MAPNNHDAVAPLVRWHDVPNEILLLVFLQLSKEELKSARLVCKLWSFLPLGFLFDRIYISPHSVNVQVFDSIAAHPLISRCITEVVYDVCDFRAGLSRLEYFDALCHQLYSRCLHLPLSFEFETPDEQLNEVLQYARGKARHIAGYTDGTREDLSRYRVVDRGHRAYLESSRQQEEYHKGGELLAHLCLGLKQLPAVTAVVLGGIWGDFLTDRQFDHTKRLPVHRCGSPLARTWNPLFLEPRAIGRRARGHVDFFTMIRGLSLSQKKVSRFESTRWLNLHQDTFDTKTLMSPSLLHHTVNALSTVERLTIKRVTSDYPHHTDSIDALPAILRSMSALKDLSLDMDKMSDNNDDYPYTLLEIFGPQHAWCHLASLRLASFAADESNLLGFLVSLPALRVLNLQDGELTSGNWASALEQFRRLLKLKTLTLMPALLHLGGVDIWGEEDWREGPTKQDIERYFRYGGKNPFRVDS